MIAGVRSAYSLWQAAGEVMEVQLTPDGSAAANPAFDVTPARLLTGLITEFGVVAPNEAALRALVQGRP